MGLRPEGPGKDFDDMWNRHRREAEGKAARGESHWAADAALRKINETPQPEQSGGRHAKPNSDSCIVPLALLGGLGWALSEIAGRIF
jgi:hypothetical protein